ncbi:LytTR family DNA-binding domain-containing protein [Mucilaginibacter sp. BJC16-A38]|uniref:LytR/AlgR family response regulator transcription factor n=1 Tax=Mucilaginibacter phenanthrenivorans TaxID=1234842 RepID=UPI0021587E86|nr:LytTR family DNA-binding domain-containing protein [Mucilaginibacter phenanthrenivorans]MCR8561199.1 LytTR family DNA-binding domain-containing protein [Mucilaginibacter phenanthrenivorans]
MNINCIVVDDEPIARDILKNYIEQVPYLTLVASCEDAFEAMRVLNANDIDLIILDINMPRLTGFEMLRSLKKYPAVIITSAYPEYALEGFELSVTDYLLKPFSFPRFVQATEKAVGKTSETAPTAKQEELFLMVKSDKKLTKIFFDDISYIEAYGNYIFIYTGQERVMSKQTLTQFELQLPASKFARIHKSYIASLKAIKYLEGNEVSIAGKKLPVGKVYRDSLMSKLR